MTVEKLNHLQIDRLRFLLADFLHDMPITSDTVHDALVRANMQLPEFDQKLREKTGNKGA